jgi:phenylacetate-CoA ligase
MIKKHAYILVLKITGNSFEKEWNEVKKIKNEEDLSDIQEKYLKSLILHAYHSTPHYTILEKDGVIKDNKVFLQNFGLLPLLTKESVREMPDKFVSKDYSLRKWYYNSSGGSTGEPIRFIQDRLYAKWQNATLKGYYQNILGIDELGVKKILLWGSERDVFEGTIGFKAKVNNWLTNTMFLNSFVMTQRNMKRYVKIINSFKPDLIRGYASSLYELCRFVGDKLPIHSPKIVVSAAETLQDEVKKEIEKVFATKVYNFFGSREVGPIAGECRHGLLHMFTFNNHTEVINKKTGTPVEENQEGNIIVTNLHNYSMPLIRYEIGDMAILGPKTCECGNPLPTLIKITGRVTDHFEREDGTIIHGEYFTHLFYLKDWIKAFQVVQEDYKKIRVYVSLRGNINDFEKKDIENKIKLVIGQDCMVIWEIVEKIPRTKSGKHLYTRSLVHRT